MDVRSIIQQPEGRRLEFKENLPKGSDLCKTIVAFANDAGGTLWLGIKDNPREIIGITEEELLAVEEQVSNLIYDQCAPVIIPDISSFAVDDAYILKIAIARGNNLPYFLRSKGQQDGTYIRVGSTNRQASEEIITELERQKRNISFDADLVFDKNWQDIDISSFRIFYTDKTGEALDENTLRKLQLIKPWQDELKATHALVLLSNDELRNNMFPYAKVECALFKGTTTEQFIDQKTISTNIASQAEEAYQFVLKHINQGAKVRGVYTVKNWEYPIKAIREAIRNAIVHRDYSLTGKDIKIAIYEDMVEITSPGKLMASIDFNEMEARQSDIRNKVIAPIFKKLGIIDQWGNGLKLIADELKEYPEIEFKWFERGLQFQVQFIKKSQRNQEDSESADLVEVNDLPGELTTKSRLSYDQATTMLELCRKPRARKDILISIGYKNHSDNYKKFMEPLVKQELIRYTIPNIPKSPNQKYIITDRGMKLLKILKEKVIENN